MALPLMNFKEVDPSGAIQRTASADYTMKQGSAFSAQQQRDQQWRDAVAEFQEAGQPQDQSNAMQGFGKSDPGSTNWLNTQPTQQQPVAQDGSGTTSSAQQQQPTPPAVAQNLASSSTASRQIPESYPQQAGPIYNAIGSMLGQQDQGSGQQQGYGSSPSVAANLAQRFGSTLGTADPLYGGSPAQFGQGATVSPQAPPQQPQATPTPQQTPSVAQGPARFSQGPMPQPGGPQPQQGAPPPEQPQGPAALGGGGAGEGVGAPPGGMGGGGAAPGNQNQLQAQQQAQQEALMKMYRADPVATQNFIKQRQDTLKWERTIGAENHDAIAKVLSTTEKGDPEAWEGAIKQVEAMTKMPVPQEYVNATPEMRDKYIDQAKAYVKGVPTAAQELTAGTQKANIEARKSQYEAQKEHWKEMENKAGASGAAKGKVRMTNPDTGKSGQYTPDEASELEKKGWLRGEEAPGTLTDNKALSLLKESARGNQYEEARKIYDDEKSRGVSREKAYNKAADYIDSAKKTARINRIGEKYKTENDVKDAFKRGEIKSRDEAIAILKQKFGMTD